jgi:two-component system sensor histidine kinase DesK
VDDVRWRRWSELGRVERVDVYTRISLHLVLWGFCASILGSALLQHADDFAPAVVIATAAGAVVVCVLGSRALEDVIDLYPATRPLPWRTLAPSLVAAVAYVLGLAPFIADEVQGAVLLVGVVNVSATFGGLPDRLLTYAVVVGSSAAAILLALDVRAAGAGVVAAFIVFSVRVSLWIVDVVSELDETRRAQARLAVAEERLRFSRDVHDVLGRRLSTIAVQAELAATLAERGDERAAARMLDVRAVAHDALAEARELARGYRPTDLPTELEGARSLLRSAGIEVDLDAGVVPRGWHEAAGWVVREAVTNVLRHSDATRVSITYGDGALRVANDGVRDVAADEGSGLGGLRERLGALGATLDVDRSPERWVVAVALPGAGPLSAARQEKP